MEKIKFIIQTFFNTHSFNTDGLSKEWIDYRIGIYVNYTLRSIKSQTNQDFTAHLVYDNRTEALVLDALSKYEKLPSNVEVFNYKGYNRKLISKIEPYEYFYLIRIDSDDMYHMSYIQQLKDLELKEGTQAIINQNGYIYDSIKNRISKYFYESPPFYTLVYKTEDYINGFRYKTPNGHEGIITLQHEIINKPNFIFHVHSHNTLNEFEYNNYGEIIEEQDKIDKILENYIGK